MNVMTMRRNIRSILDYLSESSSLLKNIFSLRNTVIYGSILMYDDVESFLRSDSDIDLCIQCNCFYNKQQRICHHTKSLMDFCTQKIYTTLRLQRKYTTARYGKTKYDTFMSEIFEYFKYGTKNYKKKIQIMHCKELPFTMIRYVLSAWYTCNMLICTMDIFGTNNCLFSRIGWVSINTIVTDYRNKNLRFTPELKLLLENNSITNLCKRTIKMVHQKKFSFTDIDYITLSILCNSIKINDSYDDEEIFTFVKYIIIYLLDQFFVKDVTSLITEYIIHTDIIPLL